MNIPCIYYILEYLRCCKTLLIELVWFSMYIHTPVALGKVPPPISGQHAMVTYIQVVIVTYYLCTGAHACKYIISVVLYIYLYYDLACMFMFLIMYCRKGTMIRTCVKSLRLLHAIPPSMILTLRHIVVYTTSTMYYIVPCIVCIKAI